MARRLQIVIFGLACTSLILGTALLVLELASSKPVSVSGPFWKDFDAALSANAYSEAWNFLEERVSAASDNGTLPRGSIHRIWDLWTANPRSDLLEKTLIPISASLGLVSARDLGLLLLEANQKDLLLRLFANRDLAGIDTQFSDEVKRLQDPKAAVESGNFDIFPSTDPGLNLDRGAAAAYLGDLDFAKQMMTEAKAVASSEIAPMIELQFMRVLWDMDELDQVDNELTTHEFPDLIVRDSSFIADLSTLGPDRIQQANIYHHMLQSGWRPGVAHIENMRLLRDYTAGAAEILQSDNVDDANEFETIRALLLDPTSPDIKNLLTKLSSEAQQSGNERLLRLVAWYSFEIGDNAAFNDLLAAKEFGRGAWWQFYSTVMDTGTSVLDSKLHRGVLGVATLLNQTRVLILQSRVAEANLRLESATNLLKRESKGLDLIPAQLENSALHATTPYARLRADALALKSLVDRLSGRPDLIQKTLRELHDLNPSHPIFSRSSGINLSARDIFGADTEEYYSDTPKE